MKKTIIWVLSMVTMILLVACGNKKDERALSAFTDKYVTAGVEVDMEEKPIFQMVGAVDGVIFYMDEKKVAIYQYEDEKALEKAQKDFSSLVDTWPTNGKYLLESSNEKAIEIFNGVEK